MCWRTSEQKKDNSTDKWTTTRDEPGKTYINAPRRHSAEVIGRSLQPAFSVRMALDLFIVTSVEIVQVILIHDGHIWS